MYAQANQLIVRTPTTTRLAFPSVASGKRGYESVRYPVLVSDPLPGDRDKVNVRASATVIARGLAGRSDVFVACGIWLHPAGLDVPASAPIDPPGQLLSLYSGQDVTDGFAFDDPYWQPFRFGTAWNAPKGSRLILWIGPESTTNVWPEYLTMGTLTEHNLMEVDCWLGKEEE